jgi:outer membrane protein assembly factor BamB
MDGTVIAQDALTGSILWEIDCTAISGVKDCYDSVEAEFIISRDGTRLFYGDFKGNIVSLVIGILTNSTKVGNTTVEDFDTYTGVLSSAINLAT